MRSGLSSWIARALALTVLAHGALADTPPQAPDPGKPLPQVTVEAERVALERRLFAFVTDITRTAPRGESLRIWRSRICPLVAGLGKDQGEFILARLSQAAQAAGAPLDGAKCRPNLYGASAAVTNKRVKDSRLVFNDVMIFSSVIVIVDGKEVAGLQFGQLADYIAMTAMTELDPDASLGTAPTILRLFADRAAGATPPSGLTPWDAAFLRALYLTPLKNVTQRSSITTQMLHSLAP